MSYLTEQLKTFEYPQQQTQAEIDAVEQANQLMDEAAAEIEKLTESVTLRDQMAMAAMSGWLASFGDEDIHPVANEIHPRVARDAYEMADAMLEERDK